MRVLGVRTLAFLAAIECYGSGAVGSPMLRVKNIALAIPGTPAARRRERPPVPIWLGPGLVQAEQRVLELARERGWRVVDRRQINSTKRSQPARLFA